MKRFYLFIYYLDRGSFNIEADVSAIESEKFFSFEVLLSPISEDCQLLRQFGVPIDNANFKTPAIICIEKGCMPKFECGVNWRRIISFIEEKLAK